MSLFADEDPTELVHRVLLVDDDALVLQGLRGILAGADDIEVIGEAASGIEAIELARRHRPDVVMMDVRMPGMPGYEAAAQLRELLPQTQIVAITSFDSEDYVFRMLEAGALGFLLKDASRAEFISAVHAVRRGDGFVSPRSTAHIIARFSRREDHAARQTAQERFRQLSDRERDVAVLVAEGASNNDIARELHVSVATVKTHLEQARIKLGAHNRALVCVAVERAGFGPGDF